MKKIYKYTILGFFILTIPFWGPPLFFFGLFLLYLWIDGPVGSCLDIGGVYDPELKVCRYDCLKWTKEEGCIPLPDDYEPNRDWGPAALKICPEE